MMKCDKCGFDSDKSQFRYLYNVKIDESISFRECPKCYTYVECDELAGEKELQENRSGSQPADYSGDSSGQHVSHGAVGEEGQAVSQDWGKYRDQWMKGASKKGVSRDEVPDKACGYCENFTPSSYAGSGSGTCNVLKMGSDLATGVYVTEGGGMAMPTLDITDGGQCKHFKKLEHVDTNTNEVWNPLQRSNRLFKEK